MSAGDAFTLVGIVVTLGIAVVGWAFAIRAGRVAKAASSFAERSAVAAERSAEEARQANAIAAEANERADRAERRATVRNDVRWESRDVDDDWVIYNTGDDPAYDVVVILRLGHDDADLERISVGDVPALSDVTVVDLQELKARKASEAAERADKLYAAGIIAAITGSFPLQQRILWHDSAGGAHTTEEETYTIG